MASVYRTQTDYQINPSYRDPRNESFSSLRVLNEDRVAAHTGFGTHSHQHYEIFSYVIDGKLEQ